MKALGTHIVCELSGCDPTALSDVDGVHAMMVAAARAANATILQSSFHRFEPQGVSGTVILAESHLSIHTYPEHGIATLNLYCCRPRARLEGFRWHAELMEALGARSVDVRVVDRGTEE